MRHASKARRREAAGGLWETLKTIVYAVLIAIGVRTFLYEPFNIPSSSMVPTLLIGDYLFVSKYSYGYSKHSLPFSLPLFSGRILAGEPERGDVIVFKLPEDNTTDYIKRVVGLPGDTIQVIGGILHINGQPVERRRIEDYYSDNDAGNCQPCRQYIETLPNGRRHRIVEMRDDLPKDNTEPYQVPAGHYFMMGDNRDNSDDSRGRVGFVPAENLVGRAEILFWSTDGTAELWELWKMPWSTRWNRLLDGIN